MKLRYLAPAAMAVALAACSTQSVKPPEPAQPACLTKTSKPIEFRDLAPALTGQCVRLRGLSVNSLLYENGATYQVWQKTPDRNTAVSLTWKPEEPAALKTHPQFVEIVGRVGKCGAGCAQTLSIAVDSYKIIPTAMD